jgi:hypothetical protein
VSGVEGVWIAGKGVADAELEYGFRLALLFGADVPDDDDGCSLLDPGEREAGLRCVMKRWTI